MSASSFGVAGSITTGISLLALISLIAYAIAKRESQRLERTFAAAITSGNQLIVDTVFRRFSVNTDKLTKQQAYSLALEQIRGQTMVLTLKYSLMAGTIVCFLILVAAIV